MLPIGIKRDLALRKLLLAEGLYQGAMEVVLTTGWQARAETLRFQKGDQWDRHKNANKNWLDAWGVPRTHAAQTVVAGRF